MWRGILFVTVVAVSGCQRFNDEALDCEREYFCSRSDYYNCCKARDLRKIRASLEKAAQDSCEVGH